MNPDNSKKTILKVSVIGIIVNLLLTAFKLTAGIIGNSSAMISDAVHTASDVISTVIVIVGVIVSTKPTDSLHPYGHERLECVASVILSFLLFVTGAVIGYEGITDIVSGEYLYLEKPTAIALIAAGVSIAVKLVMFIQAFVSAKKTNSLSLKSDAFHHLSDSLSSIGSLVGIGATIFFDMPIFDVIASLVICLLIIKVSITIFTEAVNKMVDESCSEEETEKIKTALFSVDGVVSVDCIKTRMFGNRIYVDIEIGALKTLTLEQAHVIAENAHDAVEKCDENIKHCMVHVNPTNSEKYCDISKKENG